MTKLLGGIESQPRFPQEDLTEDNAALLELMLANPDIAKLGHAKGEQFVPAFQLIHPAALRGTARVHEEPARLEALDHGIASFETLCLLLASNMNAHPRVAAVIAARFAGHAAAITSVEQYLYGSLETMRDEMPLTTEVVSESSRRFFGYFTEYALLGAALARQMELDAIEVDD